MPKRSKISIAATLRRRFTTQRKKRGTFQKEKFSEFEMAELLTDPSPISGSGVVYIEATPEDIARIDKALADQMAFWAEAFKKKDEE